MLLVEIDVGGPANLEPYSTHLVAGNDLRPRTEGVHPPNPFRLRQGDLICRRDCELSFESEREGALYESVHFASQLMYTS